MPSHSPAETTSATTADGSHHHQIVREHALGAVASVLGPTVDDAGMLELLEPWRGHRQRVVRMLYLSGFRKPAFGPRMTVQDHRGH